MATRILLLWTKDEAVGTWTTALSRGGYDVGVQDRDGVRMGRVWEARPDLILVDMRPPRENALRWCRELRRDARLARTPILAVAAGRAESDGRLAVAAGANGGIARAIAPAQLLTNIRGLLGWGRNALETTDIRAGAVTISPLRMRVYLGNRIVPGLSLLEFRTLQVLAECYGRPLTRRQILAATHGEDPGVSERSVDVQVVGLRKKFGADAALIESVRGIGYRLAEHTGNVRGQSVA